MVLFYILHLHGSEGSEPHMERHSRKPNALCFYPLEQLLRKMKSGGWGGCGTVMLCVNGLIAVFVLKLMRDLRRQRHLPQLIEKLFKNALRLKMYEPVAVLYTLRYLTLKKSFSENDYRPRTGFFARAHQTLPYLAGAALKQKNLY